MRFGPTTGAVILALAFAASSAAAEDAPAAEATGAIRPPEHIVAAPLHRLGADGRQLLLVGEADSRTVPVFLTAAEARAHAHLRLAVTSAVSVMPELSRLRVFVNDVPVSDTPVASPSADDPGLIDVELPASLLEPGYNAVRFDVDERHRVDCSVGATYELWTKIDPATAGFAFDGLPASSLSDPADLPALPPAEDGSTPIRLVLPKGADAAAIGRALRAAEAVTLRGRFQHPDVSVEAAPADRPGLDVVVGTADELRAANLGDLVPAGDADAVLRPGTTPGQSTLVLSGAAPEDVAAAIASLLPGDGAAPIGTPSGLRAEARAGGLAVVGGTRVTLRDLGVASREFDGRLFRTGFDLRLPPDFYAADYGKLTLRIDAGYAPGLLRGSQILVRINGRDAASLPLSERAGDLFRGRPLTVPLGALRPGTNRVEIAAELATEADRACDTAALAKGGGDGGKRFVLLDSSSIELPGLARIARLPDLAATAGFGFPYASPRKAGRLVLPNPDADTLSAAATFLSRAALAAGEPLDLEPALGRSAEADGSTLAIGAASDLPAALLAAAGVDRDAMVEAWSHIDARSKAAARLRAAARASGRADPAGGAVHDDAMLYRRWSDDVASGSWRFDPARVFRFVLAKAAGFGPDDWPSWVRGEPRIAVTPDMRLAILQHAAPGGHGETLTAVVAPTGAALRESVRAVTAPELWSQLDGRAATYDPRSVELGIVRARGGDYFVPTATLSPGNLRLIAAGWLSNEVDAYVLGTVAVALLLGLATAATLKRHGVKP